MNRVVIENNPIISYQDVEKEHYLCIQYPDMRKRLYFRAPIIPSSEQESRLVFMGNKPDDSPAISTKTTLQMVIRENEGNVMYVTKDIDEALRWFLGLHPNVT